jgi:hypothetical protein
MIQSRIRVYASWLDNPYPDKNGAKRYLGLRLRDREWLEACRRRERDRDPATRRTILVCERGRERDRDVEVRRSAACGSGLRRGTDGDEDELRERLKQSINLYLIRIRNLNKLI